MLVNDLRALFGEPEPTPVDLAWRQGERYAHDQFDEGAAGQDFYVFVHEDEAGRAFYVGHGRAEEAWREVRDALWEQFVATRLAGRRYWIRMVKAGLKQNQALELEAETLALLGDTVVNGFNMTRGVDVEAFDQAQEQANQMSLLMAKAKASANSLEQVVLLEQAIELLYISGRIRIDSGIVGDLKEEIGGSGNTSLITQLVNAYLAAGSPADAQGAMARYTSTYPREANLKAIQKLQVKANKGRAPGKRVVAEAEFIAPTLLPSDWERAEERGKQVVRLRRELQTSNLSNRELRAAVQRLKAAKRFAEALKAAKRWVVMEEVRRDATGSDGTGRALSDALEMAKKAKATMEECLLIQRFIHSGDRDSIAVEEMNLRLRRSAATLKSREDQ